jgi:LysR family transcriptional regulator, transcriptional activator of nhaA
MINYKQLHYFWAVAKTGSIVRACEQLNLTPQTISGQELTEAGRRALPYAEEIFQVGGALEETLRSHPGERQVLFRVGIADVVPKSIAYHLLAPAMALSAPVRIVCREDKLERLLAELAIQRLDLVLADSPLPSEIDVKGVSHKLGESGVSFFATAKLAALHAKDFPRALHRAPILVPGESAMVRGRLMRWFGEQQIQPRIVGEFDDSALMKAFGQSGIGIFIAPSVIAGEVQRQFGVEVIGQTDDVTERFYAISVERRLTHPGVVAVTEAARQEMFAKAGQY